MAEERYLIPAVPAYSEEIRKLQDNDPASASQVFNPLFQRLIENIAYIKRQADGMGAWRRSFEAGQWSAGTLRIPKTEHGMTPTGEACMYRLFQRVDGAMVSNTWAVMESRVYWDMETQELVMESGTPFNGELMVLP